MAPISRVLRNIKDSIPQGTVLGRRAGKRDGPVEFLPLSEALNAQLDAISATRGSILYRGADEWAALAPGSAGQVLQTNGAGADPSWASAAGGSGVDSTLVYMNADDTSINPSAGYAIPFDAADHDVLNLWDVSAPTIFDVPAALDGQYIELSACLGINGNLGTTNTFLLRFEKDVDGMSGFSVAFRGNALLSLVPGFASTFATIKSAPILVAEGNQFRLSFVSNDTSVTIRGATELTWMAATLLR